MPDRDQAKVNVVMIGPLPPPIGGVANFVQNINSSFISSRKYEMKVIRTGEPLSIDSPLSRLRHDIWQSLKFIRNFKRYDPKIVHIHTSSYYSFIRNVPYFLWTRYLSDARVVVHIHGGKFREFYSGSSIVVKYLVRKTLRWADAVIVTSPSWIGPIREISGRDQDIYSLANGFEPKIFHPMSKKEARDALGLSPEGVILVTVGYLEEVKGHSFLIEAMPEVNKHYDNVSLFIIGSGTLREKLHAKAKELGVESKVCFIEGGLTSEKIALWINSSDLFVLPSLNEGNPNVLFECLGCGRPFLGTRVGGIADVIISEEIGGICRPADSHELAEAIIDLLGKNWKEDRITAYAQQYSWNMISAALADIYDRIMEKP